MNVSSAVRLVNELVYKPGWSFSAEDHTNRFEGSIKVRIDYPAMNSNRDRAEHGYDEEIKTYASFALIVQDCDDITLYRKLLDRIIQIEIHEAREFLRVEPTFWAPFHPHRIDGMQRWGAVENDLLFGVC